MRTYNLQQQYNMAEGHMTNKYQNKINEKAFR